MREIELYIGALDLSSLAKRLTYSQSLNHFRGRWQERVSIDFGYMSEGQLRYFTENTRPLYLMNARENVQSSIYFRHLDKEFTLTNIWDCQIEVHPDNRPSLSIFHDWKTGLAEQIVYRITLELTARDYVWARFN